VIALSLVLAGLTLAAPAAPQRTPPPPPRRPAPARRPVQPPPPALSIRPFALATAESMAAKETFNAIFDTSLAPFFGGGVQAVVFDRFVIEVAASRFRKNGERAFISNGETFRLGIPLTATITPLEITGGYRFRLRTLPRVRPYAAAGWTTYAYKEESDFADPTAAPPARAVDVDTRHSGWTANGGVEVRVHRWIGVGIDARYSRVTGILGTGGVSQQAGENDLGGVGAGVKLIVGR
jgi:opacity protein-like surface antigen